MEDFYRNAVLVDSMNSLGRCIKVGTIINVQDCVNLVPNQQIDKAINLINKQLSGLPIYGTLYKIQLDNDKLGFFSVISK